MLTGSVGCLKKLAYGKILMHILLDTDYCILMRYLKQIKNYCCALR